MGEEGDKDNRELLNQEAERKEVSRRDFLKLGGGALALGAVGILGQKLGINILNNGNNPPEYHDYFEPENINGVEIYGLSHELRTPEDVENLYQYIDYQFGRDNNIRIENGQDRMAQREEVLNPNERYFEIVTTRGAYNSFLERSGETNVTFEEWIHLHIEEMNLCIENAKPPSEVRAVLRRILVVDDDLPNSFWNGSTPSLDIAWMVNFYYQRPIDTDMSWAISRDYRDENFMRDNGWLLTHDENNNIVLKNPPQGGEVVEEIKFPATGGLLSEKNNVVSDYSMIHEWSHYGTTLPDEYSFTYHNENANFNYVLFWIDNGNFQKPYMSPYLSMFLEQNRMLKTRDFLYKSRIREFFERPDNIQLCITHDGTAVRNTKVHEVRVLDPRYDYDDSVPQRLIDDVPTLEEIDGRPVNFEGLVFRPYNGNKPNCWLLRVTTESGEEEQLFLPSAAFQMAKWAGIEDARFDIQLLGNYNGGRHQCMKIIDGSDIPSVEDILRRSNLTVFAKMQVPGTNAWFYWYNW